MKKILIYLNCIISAFLLSLIPVFKILVDIENIHDLDCVIVAVAHQEFRTMNWEMFDKMFKADSKKGEKILIDVKACKSKKEAEELGYSYWSL